MASVETKAVLGKKINLEMYKLEIWVVEIKQTVSETKTKDLQML